MRKVLLGLVLFAAGFLAFDYLFPQTSARIGLTLERARCGLTAKTLQVGDMEIAYLEGGPQGEDVQTVVLIHGFGADKDNFTRTSAYLTDRFHVVIPDLPGFGDSTRLMEAEYDIRTQTERLHGILRALRVKKFWMGGSSMGGAITIAYSALYPDEVLGTWLLAPAGVVGAEDSDLMVEYKKTGKSLLVAEKPEDFDVILDIATETPPWSTYSVMHVLAQRAAADYKLHKRIFDQLASQSEIGINEAATNVKAPSLIVWGDRDRALHVSGAKILHNLMPGSDLVIMEGIGHLPMIEAPKAAAQDFLAFVERQE